MPWVLWLVDKFLYNFCHRVIGAMSSPILIAILEGYRCFLSCSALALSIVILSATIFIDVLSAVMMCL